MASLFPLLIIDDETDPGGPAYSDQALRQRCLRPSSEFTWLLAWLAGGWFPVVRQRVVWLGSKQTPQEPMFSSLPCSEDLGSDVWESLW